MHYLPTPIKPGPLTRESAEALTEALRDLYGLLGGFSPVPPITIRQDAGGVSIGVDATALADLLPGGGGGGGLEVKELDGSPDYAGVTVLIVDQADGFSLSQPGAGQARLDLLSASASQAGIVDLASQHLGAGTKTVAALNIDSGGNGLTFLTAVPATYIGNLVNAGDGTFYFYTQFASSTLKLLGIFTSTTFSISAQTGVVFCCSDRIMAGNKFSIGTADSGGATFDGISATVALAKLTTGGAAGFIVVKGGIVTTYVAPT